MAIRHDLNPHLDYTKSPDDFHQINQRRINLDAQATSPHTLDFSEALHRLKAGATISRSGWNGKGMFLYLVPAASYPAQTEAAKQHFGSSVPYQSYIAMKTADGTVVPWLASQTDLLATDWIATIPGMTIH